MDSQMARLLDSAAPRPNWVFMSIIDPKAAEEVYFDGACPVCRREVSWYRRMRGLETVRWADVSQPDTVLCGIEREAALARFHVRRVDGRVVSGAQAFLAVWRCQPRLAPVARMLDRQPFLWLLDRAYGAFLLLRRLWRR